MEFIYSRTRIEIFRFFGVQEKEILKAKDCTFVQFLVIREYFIETSNRRTRANATGISNARRKSKVTETGVTATTESEQRTRSEINRNTIQNFVRAFCTIYRRIKFMYVFITQTQTFSHDCTHIRIVVRVRVSTCTRIRKYA